MNRIDSGSPGDRERMIARAFVEIGSGGNEDAIGTAHALVRWSMSLLDVTGAGVMMADGRGVLRSVMVSSDAVRLLEVAELDAGQGPCLEAHRRSSAVIHADVDVADVRWPAFGPFARAGGMRAAHAIPVLGGNAAIGVLNLFRATPGGLTGPDNVLAHAMASAAGNAVFQRRTATRSRMGAKELAEAFADAVAVERATGMLAVRLRVDIETAEAVLRRVAHDRGCALGELATAVADGTTCISLPLMIPSQQPDVAGTD